ncbi:hypothetical protein HN51_031894, partial [Arachis hypogaea]
SGPERRWFTLWRMSAVRVRLSPTHELSRYKAMPYDSTQFFRFGSLIYAMIYYSWTLIRSFHLP